MTSKPERPGEMWAADIGYLISSDGLGFFAFIIDDLDPDHRHLADLRTQRCWARVKMARWLRTPALTGRR